MKRTLGNFGRITSILLSTALIVGSFGIANVNAAVSNEIAGNDIAVFRFGPGDHDDKGPGADKPGKPDKDKEKEDKPKPGEEKKPDILTTS